MKSVSNMDFIKFFEPAERFEMTSGNKQWSLVIVYSGKGYSQSQSYIQKFHPLDCFLIAPMQKLNIVPNVSLSCRICVFSFSAAMLITHTSDFSALQLLNEFLNSSNPLISFTLDERNFSLVRNYASILDSEQNNPLQYSLLICQYTLHSMLLLLARYYSIVRADKRQVSKELTSRLLMIENVKHIINQNFSDDLSLTYISDCVFTNPSYLSRIFKKCTGIALSSYINQVRIAKAKLLLLDTDNLVIDIATACGFNNIPHFNLVFKESEGITPTQFRKINKAKYSLR